jgi:hypothetical protein
VVLVWENCGVEFSGLSDERLLELQRSRALDLRLVQADLARIAAEIAYRSRRELGYAGLAQRLGVRTAERLISEVAGISARDAGALVRVGAMVGAVADAVAAGAVGVDAADAIRSIDRPDLEEQLLTETAGLPPQDVARHARELRDAIDPDGVHDRERELRSRRYLRLVPQPDGMTRVSGLLDPESAAIVTAAVDAATSPRRGVRFVDPDDAPRVDDDRTIEQIAADALVELVRIGSTAGSAEVLGVARPAVRIHVDRDQVRIEGQTVPASPATAQRYACAVGIVPILFQDGQPLDVGRTQRLFTPRQRIALAARDGVCRFPGCGRPPSWCEAHHITPWSRGGPTNIADGILLCRHHHLLIHDNHWEVTRTQHHYALIPPTDIDPTRTPRHMPPQPPARRVA